MISCTTCAVEYDEPLPEVCPICADDRQYLPEDGQSWSSPDDFRSAGARIDVVELLPGLVGVTAENVGIAQQMKIIDTAAGAVVWDPVGWFDDATVRRLAEGRPVLAIAASHPHMFGAQIELSRALGGVPVLVNAADERWLGRRDPVIELWSGTHEITSGLTLHQIGGHFPGSAAVQFSARRHAAWVRGEHDDLT